MRRFFSGLLWTAVFLLIVLALDQLLVRVPATYPAHLAVADFYRDLRSRVIALARGVQPAPPPVKPVASPREKDALPRPLASVEALIEQRQARPAPPAAKPAAKSPAREAKPRYVYADDQGTIHFAETLAEVPEEYREKAKRLGE